MAAVAEKDAKVATLAAAAEAPAVAAPAADGAAPADSAAPADGAASASADAEAAKVARQLEKKLKKEAQKKEQKEKKEKKAAAAAAASAKKKGESKEGMDVGKEEDFPRWYNQVITKSELIEFYDISGCYILRPWSFAMWDTIREFVDAVIKKQGVQNAYFPLFVSEDRLEKEASHIEGFAPEVAWVTRSGQTDLDKPIAVRPTSETIMYPAFAKWIRSHRDLPLKLNQWSNVVRWEFKHPTPFLRSREFLWQEGHTAFATQEEADAEVLAILDLYRDTYETLLAVPVIRGRKSEKEKFAGGLYTTTVEGFIPSTGRAIQGATSHCLGQNFGKMFGITYLPESGGAAKTVWQNSWGLTTRSIGVMVMTHGDDKGLVLPPRVATLQVIVIPIVVKGREEEMATHARRIADELSAAGLRADVDARTDKTPGWKFSQWELKGVPVRVELGPRDVEASAAVAVRRDTFAKTTFQWASLADDVRALLDQMQTDMLERARSTVASRISIVHGWEGFVPILDAKGMAVAPWCTAVECEDDVKKRSEEASLAAAAAAAAAQGSSVGEADERALSGAAKTLCMPFKEELDRMGVPEMAEGTKCFACDSTAKSFTLWGRSY